ncbi:MAG: ribosome maturation factor RimP [Nitrospirota bacterium]
MTVINEKIVNHDDVIADVIANIESIIKPIIDSLGLELIEIDYRGDRKKGIVRVYIDKENGVNIDECAKASRLISQGLDVGDHIYHSYVLEVSSPGLDRSLKKPFEYIKYKGRKVKIRTCTPVNNQNFFSGIIGELKNKRVELIIEKGENVYIALEDISVAKLEIET